MDNENISLKKVVEHMECGLRLKNKFIRQCIRSEYGRIHYSIRYSKSDKDYRSNTILMVKVKKDKYEYIDI